MFYVKHCYLKLDQDDLKMLDWIKSLFSRSTIENNPKLQRFKKYFHDSDLWTVKKETTARGVAIGFFVGLTPIMPFQMLLGVIICILLRANIPIMLAASWINNPITILPIAYFTSAVGRWILNEHESKMTIIIHDLGWKLGLTHQTFFTSWIAQFGKDFFVGLPFVALSVSLLGYLFIIIVWYIFSFFQKQ